MIDPKSVTKFDRTNSELQEFWLFACCVAGKTAATQARLLENFLISLPAPDCTPFDRIQWAYLETAGKPECGLLQRIQQSRLGQYNRLYNCFRQSTKLDLRMCGIADLEAIVGVGPKTSRFFLMHSRPNQRLAALDTHILKHLRQTGHVVPTATPSNPKVYSQLEAAFLALADEAGETPADYDLRIWNSYTKGNRDGTQDGYPARQSTEVD